MHSLGILARHPLAGHVKSRLSPALPATLAARLYAALLSDTRVAAAGCAAARTWWWADDGAPLGDAAFAERQQPDGGLGERIAYAMQVMRAEAGADARVVVVGSDCPALASADFERAFAALARADVVLGPAADGGYWLLGARVPCDALFDGIAWSTDAVYAQTCARAAARGWSVEALDEKRDLDTPDDLVALVAALAAGRSGACGPALRAALRETGLAR